MHITQRGPFAFLAVVVVSFLLIIFSGCGGDDPAPFAEDGYGGSGGTSGRAGGGGDGGDGGGGGESGDGGDGGGGGGGESGDGGDGGGGGESGDGGDGGGGDGGSGPYPVPDSPTNPWIAFIQIDGSGFGQLFFVKADGTGLTEYGGALFSETEPSWSADGRLAFSAIHAANGAEVHILDFAAGIDAALDVGLLTVSRPRWLPDGTELVVSGKVNTGDKDALYLVDATTGDRTQITQSAEGDSGHDVGPDGAVYFVRKLGGTSYDIYSVPSSATPSDTPTRVTDGSGVVGGVTVHPDGTKILFARAVGNTTELIERTLAGGTQRVIGIRGDEQPGFYCGGDKIAISRDSFDSDAEIAVMDTDGELITRCTDDDRFNGSPAVSPEESADVDVSQF